MRKKLRNIGLIILAIIAVIILALTIYLSVAANQLKDVFEEEFSDLLELNCEIKGDIKVRLFPGIKLKVYDVHFSNGKEEILSGKQVNITIPFSFLFNDKLEINQLELIQPKLNVWYDKGGKSSWSLISFDTLENDQDTSRFSYTINLEKVSVKDGNILVTDRIYGDTILLEGIHAFSKTIHFTGSDQGVNWDESHFSGTLNANLFRLNNFIFKNLSFNAEGRNQLINIYYASDKIYKGSDEGNIQINIAHSPVQVKVKHTLKDFRIEKLLANFEMDTLFAGYMNFQSDLTFYAGAGSMFSTLNGYIHLEGYDLKLYGFDIDKFLKKFGKSQRFNLIDVGALFLAGPVGPVVTKGYDFARLLVPSKSDTSYISGFKSHWEIKNGVAEAADVSLATMQYRLAARGQIDFAHNQFNDFTIAVLNEYGCATIAQTLNGNFSDPKTKGVSKMGALIGPVKNFFKGIFTRKENCKPFYEGEIQHPNKTGK